MGIEQNNVGSSTVTVDPIELQTISALEKLPQKPKSFLVRHGVKRIQPTSSKPASDGNSSDRNESLPSPTTAVEHIETWKSPAINIYRVLSTFWSFALMGMNDATYGAIIYYLVDYYGLSYTIVSLIFLSPFVGYNVSAVLNNTIHMKFGRRGVAIMGPLCHILAYIMIVVHPPFPVLVLAYCLSGFGNGLLVSMSRLHIRDLTKR
jgi:fucose permease